MVESVTICPHRCRHDHITLDLDHKRTPPKRLRGLFIACAHWRRSANGHIHVLACAQKEVSLFLRLWWRLRNHDDLGRVQMDLFRVHYSRGNWGRYGTGVLFDRKAGKDAGKWRTWHPV